jgi:hypothetical protein
MTGLPAPVPVIVTEQLVPERLQVEEEKETLPFPPDWDHVIVSPDIEP